MLTGDNHNNYYFWWQGNQNNQAILASLRREGVADSALWAELGIDLNQDGDKIKVNKSDFKPST